jgi:Subtilase family
MTGERAVPLSFDAAAQQATQSRVPVPRGIAVRLAPPARRNAPRVPTAGTPSDEGDDAAIKAALPGWQIEAFAGLPDWFRAVPPAPVALAECWKKVQDLRQLPSVTAAEPLLLTREQEPASKMAENQFALAYDAEPLALWGSWRGRESEADVKAKAEGNRWHLQQLKLPADWTAWRAAHHGVEPGDGILIGHPDTGFTDHPEIKDRLSLPGVSFLEMDGSPEPGEGRDDLQKTGDEIIENPGHGTGTASVIVSAESDVVTPGNRQVVGVAPGAKVLPLRVSRSVVHFDLQNVGLAILTAIDKGADVISMSLGGPWYSQFARDCIGQAQEAGLIVIAAAGNNAPTTVFPAAFPEVIAVAATHAGRAPWRFSGLGRLVDIAAPGEAVWRAGASLKGGSPSFSSEQGTGTSFATACVAGLAAVWLSHHGGRAAIAQKLGNDRSLVPFAFQLMLAKTAQTDFDWVGKKLWGRGIPDAEKLLDPDLSLPEQGEVKRFKDVILAQDVSRLTFIGGFRGIFGVTGEPAMQLNLAATWDREGKVRKDPVEETDAVREARYIKQAEDELLTALLGPLSDPAMQVLADELRMWLSVQPELMIGLERWQPGDSLLPLSKRLLQPRADQQTKGPPAPALSPALRAHLEKAQCAEVERLGVIHRGRLVPAPRPTGPTAKAEGQAATEQATPDGSHGYPMPATRRLRAYAFDPSLETSLETMRINQVTIPTRWEGDLQPGPVGEYLEVVDVDPASGCAYQPVDLNHPLVLAQDGLPPSEGDTRFHQQMVYAVAMNTIHRFEVALGRPVFWASLRPWFKGRPADRTRFTSESLANHVDGNLADRNVQRLRIYPHALRGTNAYYSPDKRALLFGYYPGTDDDSGKHFPGGMVFTCLSHDIIAHETTHALLDGMHAYFTEPTNEDVLAFHEAFADIIALFQHFTFPEVVRQQIAGTRGDLRMDNLLGQLAQQFGQTTGKRGALRNYLVERKRGQWERRAPDPRLLRRTVEPHDRGGILVAAVFEAFLKLYDNRIADLLRIATGGTGRLPEGAIHPDLVNRLADEASRAASEVLSVCIRALDYLPPVDITFGDFLRALITADYDYGGEERRQIRIAFIDGFRSWGIYPRDVTTLSEESLRWRGPETSGPFVDLKRTGNFTDHFEYILDRRLRPALAEWQPGISRAKVFQEIHEAQGTFHEFLTTMQQNAPLVRADSLERVPLIPGLDLREGRFTVTNLRPARRTGPQGEYRTEMVVDIVQSYRPPHGVPHPTARPFRGGATLIVDMRSWEIRYVLQKRLYEQLPGQGERGGVPTSRMRLQQEYEQRDELGGSGATLPAWQGEDAAGLAELAVGYSSRDGRKSLPVEPFALLHQSWDGE